MLEKYTITKLKKPNYHPEHINDLDPTPRVLIIRAYETSRQYLVRYPDSFIHRVNEDWINTRSIFTPDHPSYTTLAIDMRQFEVEFRKNSAFQTYITNLYPNLAAALSQRIEAKHRSYQERYATPAPTTPIKEVMPIPVPEPERGAEGVIPIPALEETVLPLELQYLASIDSSLKLLVQLWSGGR